MSMVPIPYRNVDPKWPVSGFTDYPWNLRPTFKVTLSGRTIRIPDYCPLPQTPQGPDFKWRPGYTGLHSLEEIIRQPYRIYDWRIQGDGKDLPTSGYPLLDPDEYPHKYYFMRHFDQGYRWHTRGKFYKTTYYRSGYNAYTQNLWVKERENFLKWGPKTLNQMVKPLQTLFDSRDQHPSSFMIYTSIRINPRVTHRQRQIHRCKNFKRYVLTMAYMVEFAARDGQQIIILEQTPLAEVMFRRIMFGFNLNATCMYCSTITYLIANYKCRYPSLYLFPCIVGIYCWWINLQEFQHLDPSRRYIFWETWINDPAEHEVFPILDLHPELLLQEQMTFMQLDFNGYLEPLNFYSTLFAVLIASSTLIKRLRFDSAAEIMEFEVLACDSCKAPTIRVVKSLLHPLNMKCTFDDEMGPFTRTLFWIGVSTLAVFLCKPFIMGVLKTFHWNTRTRLTINEVLWRALRGERRYQKMVGPMYKVFQGSYPKQAKGVRKERYLTPRFIHETSKAAQNHF